MKYNLYDILSQYDSRRNRAYAAAERQKTRVYAACPALRELEEQRRDILLGQLEAILKNPAAKEDIVKKAAQQTAAVNERILLLVEKEGIDLASLRPAYVCPVCRDTGYREQAEGSPFCECLLKRIYEDIYGAEDISLLEGGEDRFDEAIFNEASGARKRIQSIRRFIDQYAQAYPENHKKDLVLLGDAGLGKSFMLAYLAKKLQKKTRDILYIRAGKLFGVFHLHRLGELSLVEPLYDAAVLMIDDLGTEPMTQNVTREYLFELVEHRTQRGLPTMLAANMNEQQLKERYSERISSRLFAQKQSSVIRFIGADLRLAP